ncbi:hypothetical protein KVR01_005677 [Diaporthe batatas]|uniref:uncharacterized protein n=1 Tax=Diaporthe batatas TaxID=748121 RepID=UPI001D054019|nr:uncharacterized protein KVR01_005677 [Diaporthe batatas]KAG8165402.1 hypothetical protein KVR01_005677 [Diaporthe batatas]
MADKQKGPLLRLAGIKSAQLPAATASPEELTPFITSLLKESVPFIDTAAPRAADFTDPAVPAPPASNTLWKSKGSKTHPDSTAKIDLSERVVPVDGGADETWACRRSVHADEAARGTASWAEFADCIRDRHPETEDAFTPTVLAHREAVSWGGAKGAAAVEVGGVAWGRFTLALLEMKHKIPPPLKPRVFPVLQLVASAVSAPGGGGDGAERDEFVVVSVTVSDLATGPLKEQASLSLEKGVVVGAYVSVERVRRLPGQGEDKGKIEWVMATASDAKGILPLFLQTKAIPGQIAKDVGMFLGWVDKERAKKG